MTLLETRMEVLPDGRRVRFARLGTGGPPVVLLHGYPESLQIWSAVAPLLARRFDVLALDWPGMGASDEWPGGASPTHMANRLVELLDFWKIPAANVVAMDMGGQAALAAAILHPNRVRALVVMNSLVMPDAPTSWEIRVLRELGWNRLLIRHAAPLVFRRAERTFLPRGIRLPAELRADFRAHFLRKEVRRFVARMCAGYQGALPRLASRYGEVTCPTLALWGRSDRHFPPVHAERLHAAIPGSRLAIVEGGEHWMALHRAEEVAASIEGFLHAPREQR